MINGVKADAVRGVYIYYVVGLVIDAVGYTCMNLRECLCMVTRTRIQIRRMACVEDGVEGIQKLMHVFIMCVHKRRLSCYTTPPDHQAATAAPHWRAA